MMKEKLIQSLQWYNKMNYLWLYKVEC